jgi:hypothetical protein
MQIGSGTHERKSVFVKPDVDGMMTITCSIRQWMWAGFVWFLSGTAVVTTGVKFRFP